ncbi:MAG: DUF1963 domain-containing protein [Actinobacteria bacterium]|nr:DUF1963 domain-containing protein [Actinomycetota bacterium]
MRPIGVFDDRTSRRHALKELLRGAARGAQELATPLGLDLGLGRAPVRRRIERPQERSVQGSASRGAVSVERLLDWATDAGLGQRSDAILRLAVPSLRAVPDTGRCPPPGRSRMGGEPSLTDAGLWPRQGERHLPFLAQFELPEAPGGEPDGLALAGPGLLLVFLAPPEPGGIAVTDSGSCRVLWLPGEGERKAGRRRGRSGRSLHISRELTLPRAWYSGVGALELSDEERRAWEQLRSRLAKAQGVELHDKVDGSLVLNRLFGYPDERRGDMRLICELLDLGADLEGGLARNHPLAERAQAGAGRWRLLAQISRGDPSAPAWAGKDRRLYLWIDEDSLRIRDFSRVRALLR